MLDLPWLDLSRLDLPRLAIISTSCVPPLNLFHKDDLRHTMPWTRLGEPTLT